MKLFDNGEGDLHLLAAGETKPLVPHYIFGTASQPFCTEVSFPS